MDGQSVKTSEQGGPNRYDAAKDIRGRQRHLLVDTTGLILLVIVHLADVQDRDGARRILGALVGYLSRLQLMWDRQQRLRAPESSCSAAGYPACPEVFRRNCPSCESSDTYLYSGFPPHMSNSNRDWSGAGRTRTDDHSPVVFHLQVSARGLTACCSTTLSYSAVSAEVRPFKTIS